MSPKAMMLSILGLVAVLLAWDGFYVVKQYERAVVLRFGEVVNADVEPGLQIKIPLVDKVRLFDGRLQTMDARPERYLTLEQKALIVDSFTKWRIAEVDRFYRATAGITENARSLLARRLDNGLRDAFGARTLHEVVSGQRDELMEQLTQKLNAVVKQELGIEVVDVRVKAIDLPPQVSDSVFERMRTEREKEAQEHRARGNELAEGIRANADREQRVILAEAYRDAEKIRGAGDAQAAAIYAEAYQQDRDFYSFTRSLGAYRESIGKSGDILVLEPDSEFFRYLKQAGVE